MYFVAFFLQAKKHCVIPFKWVQGLNYEYIVNNGVNRNIKFRAFWTDDKNAFDENGVPRINYVPNLNANGKVFPAAGWYLCQIRKIKRIVWHF